MRLIVAPGGFDVDRPFPTNVNTHGLAADPTKPTTVGSITTGLIDFDTGLATDAKIETIKAFDLVLRGITSTDYDSGAIVDGYTSDFFAASAQTGFQTNATIRLSSPSWSIGDAVSIKSIGYNTSSRDTIVTSNGVSDRNDVGTTFAEVVPAASVSTVTTDDGAGNAIIDIDFVKAPDTDFYGYWSFVDVEITAHSPPPTASAQSQPASPSTASQPPSPTQPPPTLT